jgi:hypothetical protein
MKKILLLIFCFISFNAAFASENPNSTSKEGVRRNGTKTMKALKKNGNKPLLPDACSISYNNSLNTLINQMQSGLANCALSNQIVVDFDLQGCNNLVNSTFMSGYNSIGAVNAVCTYFLYYLW